MKERKRWKSLYCAVRWIGNGCTACCKCMFLC